MTVSVSITCSRVNVRLCVQSSVRKGVLPSMLEEILNTRFMVKRSMKSYKEDKALMKLLDARQLGLKLIANVTFGYTAANYSGRMPSVEVSSSQRFTPKPLGGTEPRGQPLCAATMKISFDKT